MSTATWPQIVGYRHEVVHTGALGHLLRDETAGVALLRALTGADIARVLRTRVEARIAGFRGRADLVADVELDGEGIASVGVETKVDSNATREQLTATAIPPAIGVLLAVGVTALNLTQEDLGPDLEGWSVVGPGRWAAALKEVGADRDLVLAPYVADVEREAAEHKRARALVNRTADPGARIRSSRREGDGLLEHYAWLAGVREGIEDQQLWWTYTNRSGPLMGLWREDFQRSKRDTFLEFMCSHSRRILCLKIGSGKGELRAVAADAFARVEPLGWQPGRQPSASDQTCTAAWLDFSAFTAQAAAHHARRAIADVAAAMTGPPLNADAAPTMS